ncbi:MAG TPA: RDD family protein [Dermatophilaceae bacterium]|nr:RDD family protein [Dermatophilaceae bacterium]
MVTSSPGPASDGGPQEQGYAGQRLGLPAAGPGSVATFGRRAVAVFVDWMLCQLIAIGVLGVPIGSGGAASFAPLGVFAVENLLLVSTLGTTVGHRLVGLRVRPLRPGFFPLQVLVRTGLLCLFVPAVLSDSDGIGLHDRVAGTVIVRG